MKRSNCGQLGPIGLRLAAYQFREDVLIIDAPRLGALDLSR